MGNVTYTATGDIAFTIGGNKRLAVGSIQMSNSYATGGDAFNPANETGMSTIHAVLIEQPGGYLLEFDDANNKIKAYLPSGSPTLSNESAHTHAVALDGGATAAEAAHTHAVALDGGATAAEAAHTHAVALDGGASAAGTAHSHAYTGLSIDNESTHTHAVALDGGATAAEAAHTHAVALDTGSSAAGSAHTHTATASTVNPRYQADSQMVGEPTIALTHNADPPTNLSANALYIIEADGEATQNNARLESNCNGTANVLGETANGAVGGVSASARFFVQHDATPDGVQIYVNEGSSDQLEFVSPTDTDAWIIMPFEGAAGMPPGYAVAVKVHDNDGAASGKALYFDDNGAADAQLIFNDAGAVGGTIPAADVVVLCPAYIGPAADNIGLGSAEAQSLANESAHTHGPGTLADAASAAGSSHTHGPGTLADAASGAGAAHTHTMSGTIDNESTHTHGAGTLADAASGAGSSHTHGPGTLADAASAAGSSHTHGPGTLADAASAAGSAHTHTATAETADEVGNATDLSSAITGVKIVIIGS